MLSFLIKKYMQEKSFKNLKEIEDYVNKVISESIHLPWNKEPIKLKKVRFGGFTNAKKQMGVCKYFRDGEITIELFKPICILNIDNRSIIEDTIKHELAHAIEYELYGNSDHGNRWKRIAKVVGANPQRLYTKKDLNMPKSKYTLKCKNCGLEENIYR